MITSYEQLRTLLIEERRALRAKLQTLTIVAHDGVAITNHQADDGTEAFDQARDLAVMTRSERTLRQVEDALVKFERGTYGFCENCGKEIDIARLEAIPYTPLCLSCAENRDSR